MARGRVAPTGENDVGKYTAANISSMMNNKKKINLKHDYVMSSVTLEV